MAGDRARSVAGADGGDPRRRIGAVGEAHAAELIEARGGVVISRNWRTRTGELDLVVLDARGRLRFVEVRTRTGTAFGTPAESVTVIKRRRLRRLATEWLTEHPGAWRQVCFDVIGVDLADPSRPRLELFEDVF
jgi:putative endonuclease